MPNLEQVASALRRFHGRYEYLDAFADDIDEIRTQSLQASLTSTGPQPTYVVRAGDEQMRLQFFPHGVVRFGLGSTQGNGNTATAAAIGAILGGAIAAAGKAKGEGLLGGLMLGMLVGGAIGQASTPVERVLALQFDSSLRDWRLYDGPLLRWAKGAINPGLSA